MRSAKIILRSLLVVAAGACSRRPLVCNVERNPTPTIAERACSGLVDHQRQLVYEKVVDRLESWASSRASVEALNRFKRAASTGDALLLEFGAESAPTYNHVVIAKQSDGLVIDWGVEGREGRTAVDAKNWSPIDAAIRALPQDQASFANPATYHAMCYRLSGCVHGTFVDFFLCGLPPDDDNGEEASALRKRLAPESSALKPVLALIRGTRGIPEFWARVVPAKCATDLLKKTGEPILVGSRFEFGSPARCVAGGQMLPARRCSPATVNELGWEFTPAESKVR